MSASVKVASAGLFIAVATAAAAQPGQQVPAYQPAPMPMMSQGQPMSPMTAQSMPMMNDPQMRQQMADMRQECARMMGDMRPMMRGDRRR